MNILGIIPARWASTRFPGKPLFMIQGKSMIQRVYEQVKQCPEISQIMVATDDERIYNHVRDFQGEAEMTLSTHNSGTERCLEAYLKSGKKCDYIINIQGDEPFIKPQQIKTLIFLINEFQPDIATLCYKISKESELFNPNVVKVVFDNEDFAIYFSRHPIPFLIKKDNKEWLSHCEYYKHIGIYAYKPDVLSRIYKMKPALLEQAESLEQLRWMVNGIKIKTGITTFDSRGIDTPEDVQLINEY